MAPHSDPLPDFSLQAVQPGEALFDLAVLHTYRPRPQPPHPAQLLQLPDQANGLGLLVAREARLSWTPSGAGCIVQ